MDKDSLPSICTYVVAQVIPEDDKKLALEKSHNIPINAKIGIAVIPTILELCLSKSPLWSEFISSILDECDALPTVFVLSSPSSQ